MSPLSARIRTFTGRQLDLLAPDPEAIAIEDIAHGLAHTCRFSGQCARFYSVAEHAVRVSYMVPARDALVGLLHDASEAYLSDLVSPLKVLGDLTGYRVIEANLMAAIYRRFCPTWAAPETTPLPGEGIPGNVTWMPGERPGLHESVIRADHELVELEMAVLFDGLEILDLDYHAPVVAERLFLARFEALSQTGPGLECLTPAGEATRLHYDPNDGAGGQVWLDTDIGHQDGLTIGVGRTRHEALVDARTELRDRLADLDRVLTGGGPTDRTAAIRQAVYETLIRNKSARTEP